jgi:outer membrane protein assembly factor BamB
MSNFRLITWFLVAALAGVTAGLPAADDPMDWPGWRGPLRNGAAPKSPRLAEEWPAWGPRKVWENHSLPGGGNGSPAIANGAVYVYIHDKPQRVEFVVCLDAATGRVRWKVSFPVDRETLHWASGTPCVADGRVYVMGARVCYCLEADTGKLVWKNDTGVPAKDPTVSGSRQEVSSSFVVEGDVAAVCAGPAFGLDAKTGKELWRAPEAGGYAGVMTSVAVWRSPDGVRLVYGGMDRLCILDLRKGTVLWEEAGDSKARTYAASPAIDGNWMVMTHAANLQAYQLQLPQPQLLWRPHWNEEYSSPAIADGRVFQVGKYNSSEDYFLICMGLKEGGRGWQEPLPKAEYTSPIVADGKVFVLAGMGKELMMFDASGGKLLGKSVVGATQWTSPAIAGGKLYVRLGDGMACYDLTREACAPPAFRAEGEALRIVGKSMRGVGPQEMAGFGPWWSGDKHLFLVAGVDGWIELALDVPRAGRYELIAFLTKAPDYGIVEFALNGKKVGAAFDGYDKRVVPSGPVNLGEVDVPKGRSVLRLTVIDRNEESQGFLAGLDAVELRER